jgi:hypothetical protein
MPGMSIGEVARKMGLRPSAVHFFLFFFFRGF